MCSEAKSRNCSSVANTEAIYLKGVFSKSFETMFYGWLPKPKPCFLGKNTKYTYILFRMTILELYKLFTYLTALSA